MNKKRSMIFIILGCFLIATLGIAVPLILLRNGESSILDKKQIVSLGDSNKSIEKDSLSKIAKMKFSEDDLATILTATKNVNTFTYETKYIEPIQGQLSMYEVVSITKQTLRFFQQQGIVPDSFDVDNIDNITANCIVGKDVNITENPEYAFWYITLEMKNGKAELISNAVSGQVISCSVHSSTPISLNGMTQEEGMKKYLEYLNLDIDAKTIVHQVDFMTAKTSKGKLKAFSGQFTGGSDNTITYNIMVPN